MGKTIKGKDKAARKTAAAKRKIARKCKGKCAAIVAAFGLALLATGCATSDNAQPAKANTMNNTFDDCIIVVATHASVSNRIVTAEGTKDIPAVELFTQTQSLENSGTDTTTQTTTQTPTTDVKPDIDVRYNDAIAGATSASKGVLDLLTDTGKAAVLELMSSKKSGTVKVEKTDGSSATVKCENGQCEFCEECTVN